MLDTITLDIQKWIPHYLSFTECLDIQPSAIPANGFSIIIVLLTIQDCFVSQLTPMTIYNRVLSQFCSQ